MNFCCPINYVRPVVGQTLVDECIVDPGFNIPEFPAPSQCPIRFPYPKYPDDSFNDMFPNMWSCCKCQDQTICEPAGQPSWSGVIKPNEDGHLAMMADNQFVDTSRFLTSRFCLKD